MNEQVIFNIKINKNIEGEKGVDTYISAYTLKELNNFLSELETSFLAGLENSIFIKELCKEEYISYINELGIKVKGSVKEYIIKEELLEYIIRLSLQKNKNPKAFEDIFIPFYTKIINVKKYILDDIYLKLQVNMNILHKKDDIEV
jgi:hypothetical protein